MGLVPAMEAVKKQRRLVWWLCYLGLVPAVEEVGGCATWVWCRLWRLLRRQRKLGWGLCYLGLVPGMEAAMKTETAKVGGG